jgi:O-acetyl-ADP-ribose deacetylase (regulator of RNase III)
MSKYTVEDFEKWLNTDASRKKGLWFWNQVIEKVRADQDLFDSLATGQDLGGWNISDPEFRKQYQFEDYYLVFLEWKTEMDSQNDDETKENDTTNKNEEEKELNHEYPALSITKQEREYKDNYPLLISSIGTENIKKNTSQMPFGSVLLTDTGTSSELKNQGIDYIIHAAMMPLLQNRSNEKDFIKVATLAIQNSIILADRQKFTKLATCFLGGNIYCPVEEVKPVLAEAIIRASLNQLENCSHLKKIIFVDFDGDYYKNAWEKIEQEENYSKIIKKTKVVKEDLLKKTTHKANVIINSENAEMEWREGISGAIKEKLGSEADKVGQQRKKLMKEFYCLTEKNMTKNNKTQLPNNKDKGQGIFSLPLLLITIIILVGLLVWKKFRTYFP